MQLPPSSQGISGNDIKSSHLGVFLLVFLLAIAVFWPSIRCGFVNYDDDIYVVDNPTVLEGLTLPNIRNAWTKTFVANWSPLTMMSYQLDASLFGIEPWGFHLTNVILHAAASGMIAVALARMTDSSAAGLMIGGLFAVHPLRVESVAWVSERKDVLSIFFLSVILLAYERYGRSGSRRAYGLVCLALLAGLLAKPMLVSVPFLLLVLDVWPLGRMDLADGQPPVGCEHASRYSHVGIRQCLVEKLPMLVLSVIFSTITLITQQDAMTDEQSLPVVSVRLPTALCGLMWYAWKTIVPMRLCVSHLHTGEPPPMGMTLASVLVFAVAAPVALVQFRRRPYIAAGLAWYGLALAPVLGIVSVGMNAVAERYSYLPHIGILTVFVLGANDAASMLRVGCLTRRILGIVIVAAAALVSVRQINVWNNSDTLWTQCLRVNPNNVLALYNYGLHLRARGDYEAAVAKLDKACGLFVKGKPPERIRYHLAYALLDAGMIEQAHKEFCTLLKDYPTNIDARLEYANSLLEKGDTAGAITMAEDGLKDDPNDVDLLRLVILANATAGHSEAAIQAARRFVDLKPDDPEPLSRLGQLLLYTGNARMPCRS